MATNALPAAYAALLFLLSLSTTANAAPPRTSLSPIEQLGKELFFDKVSDPGRMSCSTCHEPRVGWTVPVPGINLHGAVFPGSVPQRSGGRKPPTASYASFSPPLAVTATTRRGGTFWDGRATGEKLGTPIADQALGPFVNHVEQNNPDKLEVCEHVAAAKYAALFAQVWQAPIDCSTPEAVELSYNRIALSIAAFERSPEVNAFTSKFDAFLRNEAQLTPEEARGLDLLNGKGQCSGCHRTTEDPAFSGVGPLFTTFGFANIGSPKNPENPFYGMDDVLLDDGTPINPLGFEWVDFGLGGFLATRSDALAGFAAVNEGRHKFPTLRNIDKRPTTTFPKAYGHNGYFKSLKSIVHFYNTRDVKPRCPDEFTTERDALSQGCWPAPEVSSNLLAPAADPARPDIGNLGLSDDEEDAIVAFMRTLSDGYVPR